MRAQEDIAARVERRMSSLSIFFDGHEQSLSNKAASVSERECKQALLRPNLTN
jgi:hypothetical protein